MKSEYIGIPTASSQIQSPCKTTTTGHGHQHHVVHPMSSGPVNCMITVDNLIRATTDLRTPKEISLSPTTEFSNWNSKENADLLEPIQNTRHLFVREYTKPLKWSMQATKKFQVLNSSGDCIYFAIEKSTFLNRLCFFRGLCPFTLSVLSLNGEPVIEICGRPGCKANVTVKDFQNKLIGKISKLNNWCTQTFSIRTYEDTEILKIIGPEGSNCSCCCFFTNCGNEDFDVTLADAKTSIGKISSEWDYTLEDLCGVFVPMKLDDRTMSLLLGAVFLVDFSYYQRRKDVSCFGRCFLTFLFFSLFILMLFCIAKK